MIFTDKNRCFNQKEFEASIFAMCLLLPKKKVIQIYKQNNSIEEIRDYFNVPLEIVIFRLSMLNLID